MQMNATKLNGLRQDVALERYEVDAHDIAEAMLRRLAPVNWGPIPVITEAPGINEVPSIRPASPAHHSSASAA